MRVLWVTKGLGPGGAERLLCAAASRHSRDEFDVECAYVLPWKDHLAGTLEADGVRTTCLSTKRSDPLWPTRLWSLIRHGDYDVVHVHSPLPGSVARLAVRSLPSSRRPALVATEHNRAETYRRPTRLLNDLTGRLDDVDIAVTDEVRASMRDSDTSMTLSHGIDVAATAARRSERGRIRAELGIGEDEFVVGTVANFRPQKDYPNLLTAVRQLADDGVPMRLVAVGQGPQELEVRSQVEDLEISDRVILTGFRDDAVDVMSACDVFVLASAWEGLPVAVMEATALGLPIVATAVGGLVEQFTDGVDALLVPPGDPARLARGIAEVRSDDTLRDRLASASRERSADFDIGSAVATVEEVYRSVGRRLSTADADAGASPAKPTRAAPAVDIRPATAEDLPEVIELLRASLGADGDDRYRDLFRWKHLDNRFGPSPMWVAVENDEIVAFRAFMRWEFVRGGHVVRAVRAVDTATRPDHHGRGLFRALTLHGIEELRSDGVDFVFNTPNTQSRPGYLKMGWRDVGRLPAAVQFCSAAGVVAAARSRVPAERWSAPLTVGRSVEEWLSSGGPGERWPESRDVRELRTNADEDFLRWRFGGSLLGYRVVDDGESAVIVRARDRGRALELALVAAFGSVQATDRLALSVGRRAGTSYVIRLGSPQISSMSVPLPGGGPILTWRSVVDTGPPPLSNWALALGDVELF